MPLPRCSYHRTFDVECTRCSTLLAALSVSQMDDLLLEFRTSQRMNLIMGCEARKGVLAELKANARTVERALVARKATEERGSRQKPDLEPEDSPSRSLKFKAPGSNYSQRKSNNSNRNYPAPVQLDDLKSRIQSSFRGTLGPVNKMTAPTHTTPDFSITDSETSVRYPQLQIQSFSQLNYTPSDECGTNLRNRLDIALEEIEELQWKLSQVDQLTSMIPELWQEIKEESQARRNHKRI